MTWLSVSALPSLVTSGPGTNCQSDTNNLFLSQQWLIKLAQRICCWKTPASAQTWNSRCAPPTVNQQTATWTEKPKNHEELRELYDDVLQSKDKVDHYLHCCTIRNPPRSLIIKSKFTHILAAAVWEVLGLCLTLQETLREPGAAGITNEMSK